ncbi:hypothetical protein FraQA3DRAFT_0638 [Frankia sp. QA3]|nr:hypothetical protein FraQA3DRAFT_0638 [Frankia sp. QA3]
MMPTGPSPAPAAPGAGPLLTDDRTAPLPRPPVTPPSGGSAARARRIVVTFVGSDQDWADWIGGRSG